MASRKKWLISLTVGAALLQGVAARAQAPDLATAIEAHYKSHLKRLFEHFHRNPELSGREHGTADRIAQELKQLHFDVSRGIGGTGVVAVMKNGNGPTVLLRADMDGLPIKEQTGLAYASVAKQVDSDGIEKPVMHACGHDVHVTSLIGTASQMGLRRAQWRGTLILVAQPAEERLTGARAMLEDGLYTRFAKPDYALAFHVSSDTPSGKLRIPEGTAYSSSDNLNISVRGVGAHGAAPDRGIDPVLIASHIVVALQSLVSRTISPLDAGVVTVGAIHGGVAHNIIPDEVTLKVTVRADNSKVRQQLLEGVDRVATGVALSMGVPKQLLPIVERSRTESAPPTLNDKELAVRMRKIFSDRLGSAIFYDRPRASMAAEDFSYLIQSEHGVKGLYFVVGGTPQADLSEAPSHHSPFFKVAPAPAIRLGVEAMTVAAMALMPLSR